MDSQGSSTSYSLQTRLLYAFSVLLFVFLGLTGIVLDSAFRSSIEAGAADRLQVQVYLLLAAADEEDGEFYFLEDLQEPRFGQLNSGLFGFISSEPRGEIWRSDSARALVLGDSEFLTASLDVGNTFFDTIEGSNGENYFVLSYGILWEDGRNVYKFSIVEDVTPYFSEIINFRQSLWSWLGGVAFLLLLMQFFLLRWGLSPLKRMERNLKKIENGEANELEGQYPDELTGVTKNLNLLIDSERKQQARYRTTLGDLAHSLKTPLAVIVGVIGELYSSKTPKISGQLSTINEQVDRMNQIVGYQLQRAVQSQNSSTLAKQTSAKDTASKVLDALKKVYADKAVETQVLLDDDCYFYGDERDFMEVLGNVLDNAFKYGNSMVFLSIKSTNSDGETLTICVEDDGSGVPDDKRDFVLQRGARADTLRQGQGIGLAVVMDIVNSYSGDMKVSKSESLGGAKITICFKQ